ncbi:MAG: hydantoinase B/oxoprolinase family protein, partial [Thaumarchaeota archaeon]|nr:hydantoinase B/oxoprolinase family protein [Nitrososphaerota archaeon]
DLLFRVLSPVLPERTLGGTFGSDVIDFIYGDDLSKNRFYILVDTLQGGWGGLPHADGITAYAACEGNVSYPMTEMLEANYPIQVMRWELLEDSGGPGRNRGGLGVRRDYKMQYPCRITFCYERTRYSPPWGVLGGKEGRTNEVVFNPEGSNPRKNFKGTHMALEKGTVISFRTGGGGGYGNPFDRDAKKVLKDVLLGYVSVEKARANYGVVLAEDNAKINLSETAKLRESLRTPG